MTHEKTGGSLMDYEFKVGDKGKTRGNKCYEVITIVPDARMSIVVAVDSKNDKIVYSVHPSGKRARSGRSTNMDLMPPEPESCDLYLWVGPGGTFALLDGLDDVASVDEAYRGRTKAIKPLTIKNGEGLKLLEAWRDQQAKKAAATESLDPELTELVAPCWESIKNQSNKIQVEKKSDILKRIEQSYHIGNKEERLFRARNIVESVAQEPEPLWPGRVVYDLGCVTDVKHIETSLKDGKMSGYCGFLRHETPQGRDWWREHSYHPLSDEARAALEDLLAQYRFEDGERYEVGEWILDREKLVKSIDEHDCLIGAFNWDASPEGHNYWSGIHYNGHDWQSRVKLKVMLLSIAAHDAASSDSDGLGRE